MSTTNLGRFKIIGIAGVHDKDATIDKNNKKATDDGEGISSYFEYPVSLNPVDKDFILNVLGTSPSDGDAPVFVESLYDVALRQAVNEANESDFHAESIDGELTFYQVYYPADYCGLEPVGGIMTVQENFLSRKNVGQRFLADENAANGEPAITCHPYDFKTGKPIADSGKTDGLKVENVQVGQIYTVVQYTDADGKRKYFYRYWDKNTIPSGETTVTVIDKLVYGKDLQ